MPGQAAALQAYTLARLQYLLHPLYNLYTSFTAMLLLLLPAGLLVYSITCVEQQQYVLGGVLFAVLLNMKHLFAYLGPVYFAFLLRHYVLAGGSSTTGGTAGGQGTAGFSWFAALQRLVLLGSAVVAVCAVSFGPFIAMGQLKQVGKVWGRAVGVGPVAGSFRQCSGSPGA